MKPYRRLQRVPSLKILPSWPTPGDKEAMLFEFHRQKAEGVVFKHREARYRPAAPASITS
jgi:ATP-dependent DNA ligase